MNHTFVRMRFIPQMLLAEKDFRLKLESRCSVFGSIQLFLNVLHGALALWQRHTALSIIIVSHQYGFFHYTKPSPCLLITAIHALYESNWWLTTHVLELCQEELNCHVARQTTSNIRVASFSESFLLLFTFTCGTIGSF